MKIIHYFWGIVKNLKAFDNAKPWIVPSAVLWLDKYLEPEMNVFEWGMGSSTVYFARHANVFSVEHNSQWYRKVKLYFWLNALSGTLKLIRPERRTIAGDFQDPTQFRSSCELNKKDTFIRYVAEIANYPTNHFDLIVIDGRARPSCLLVAKSFVKIGGYILLDNSERKEYERGVSLLNEFERTDFGDESTNTSIFKRIK